MTLPVTPPAGVPMIRIEQLAEQPHFVRLQPLHAVRVDLRYVGSNNFAGRSLYGSLDCAVCAAGRELRGRRFSQGFCRIELTGFQQHQ